MKLERANIAMSNIPNNRGAAEVFEEFAVNLGTDNVKHEPPVEFVLILPQPTESEELQIVTKKVSVVLKKFGGKYRRKLKMFTSFLVCEKCGFVTPKAQSMRNHKVTCKGPKNLQVRSVTCAD